MTTVLLIPAAPTPWDVEKRLGGTSSLPLTADGEAALIERLKALTEPVSAVYSFARHQACAQAARLVAQRFALRVRNVDQFEPVSFGLWRGLTRDEVRFRFPSVFPQWEENPLSVNPPEGESIEGAVERFREGVKKVLRRNRGETIALVLRPVSLQIAAGILRGEDLATLAGHLHDGHGIETIGVGDEFKP